MDYMYINLKVTNSANVTTKLNSKGEKKAAIRLQGTTEAGQNVIFYQLGDTEYKLEKLAQYLYNGRTVMLKVNGINKNIKTWTATGWVKDLGTVGRDKSREPAKPVRNYWRSDADKFREEYMSVTGK